MAPRPVASRSAIRRLRTARPVTLKRSSREAQTRDVDRRRALVRAGDERVARRQHRQAQPVHSAGADDGASGVAVLMELANLFAKQKPRVNIDLALLDGEDFGQPHDVSEYFLGARELAKRGWTDRYKFALVIDMIGDKDLHIYREGFSNRYSTKINDLFWKTAAELGESAFVDSVKYDIQDDHLSFMTRNLPSAVIIDFDYPYWHTLQDTPDKCSPQSLAAVGWVVATVMYRL